MSFNISYDVCALFFLIILCGFFFKKETLYTESSKVFAALLILTGIDLILDVVTALSIDGHIQVPMVLNHILNVSFFSCQILMAVMFMLYVIALTGHSQGKKKIAILIFPGVVALGIVFSSPMTGAIYSFGDEGYMRGPFFIAAFAFMLYYVLVGLCYIIHYRSRISQLQRITIFSFLAILLLTTIFQYIYKGYLVTGAVMVLALLMMYLSFQNPDDYVDTMTGLYGRSAFVIFMDRMINRTECFEVFIIEMNDFKLINRAYGLSGGDQLIMEVAKVLETCFSKKRVFRIEGDRFAVLALEDGDTVACVLRAHFNGRWRLLEREIPLPLSICRIPLDKWVQCPEDVAALEEKAIEIAKLRGKGSFVEVDDAIIKEIKRYTQIEQILEEALEQDRLQVYFQPIYAVEKDRFTSLEVLVRLEDPELGFVPPDEFIAIAEHNGLIHRIGVAVLEKTCGFIADHALLDYGIELVEINLSTVECMEKALTERICETLDRYNIKRTMISFEITESAAIASENSLLKTMNEMRRQGLSFSMDDYGSGYSNNDSAVRFPFHIIKLDRSILWNCDNDEKAKIILCNMVDMFHAMGLKLIAEGAETGEQVRFLKKVGIDYIQGYYYSRPLPGEAFLKLLEGQRETRPC